MKKLYGHPDSGHAFKVRLFLCVAAIEHEYEVVDIFSPREQRNAEFLQHSRFGEVPLLVDDGQAVVQSNAILLHLARQSGRWGGENAQTLNRCTEWLVWEANRIGMCLPQLRSRHRFGRDVDLDAASDWLTVRHRHHVMILETSLSDGRHWFLGGEEPTIVDFSLCGYLILAESAILEVPVMVSSLLD